MSFECSFLSCVIYHVNILVQLTNDVFFTRAPLSMVDEFCMVDNLYLINLNIRTLIYERCGSKVPKKHVC